MKTTYHRSVGWRSREMTREGPEQPRPATVKMLPPLGLTEGRREQLPESQKGAL